MLNPNEKPVIHVKLVKIRKPHKCFICGRKIKGGKVLSSNFKWFCGWRCWSEMEVINTTPTYVLNFKNVGARAGLKSRKIVER